MNEKPVEVVRLRTTYYQTTKSICVTRSLTRLMRKSFGDSILWNDTDMVGVESAVHDITNLNECADGIYKIELCDLSHDHETGYIDDWKYKLVPYEAKALTTYERLAAEDPSGLYG